jgi:hypothetical protein
MFSPSQRDEIFVTADFNRRVLLVVVALSRRDNILSIKCCLYETKATIYKLIRRLKSAVTNISSLWDGGQYQIFDVN